MAEVIVVGSFVQDLAFNTELFPEVGETRIGTFKAGPGGKGFNQAIACSRLGAKTLFIGASGKDGFARDIGDFLKRESLETRLEVFPEYSTGAASIVVNKEGQNLIVVALGANDYLSASHVAAQSAVFKGAKIVVSQLESNLEATREAFKLGRTNGAKLILNPAPINQLIDLELLESADILVPNETEAAFLLKHLRGIDTKGSVAELSDSDLLQIARKLSPRTVIFTLGSAGAFVCPAEQAAFRVPAINAKAIDTTGAGDAFTGGLAAGLINYPDSLKRAVEFATVVAGLSTERQGTAPAMPSESDVRARFRQ